MLILDIKLYLLGSVFITKKALLLILNVSIPLITGRHVIDFLKILLIADVQLCL